MISFLLISIFSPFMNICFALDTSYFARIMFDNVYFFKSPVEDYSFDNVHFELPRTYFVELMDETGSFYLAKYQHLTGYVLKSSVQAVQSRPNNPYLTNINFRIYAELSRQLRTIPSTDDKSNLITNIPLYSTNLTFIGAIHGEQLISNRTDIWYYCKFTADQDYFGYVYSDFCDEMSEITLNDEKVIFIDNPTFSPNEIESIPEDSNVIGILVAILSIPAVAFLIFLVKGKQLIPERKQPTREVIDY